MTDYDGAWKEALDLYLPAFLAFFYPHIHADVDWSRPYEALDKELQQVSPKAARGRRYVDKLFRVWLKDGEEAWVLIHIEVQLKPERKFPRRMSVYNNRLSDLYNREVTSLAVLADDNPNWRPSHYEEGRWGCLSRLDFLPVKLLDYAGREAELEADRNPFAKIVLAHLKAREMRRDGEGRRAWKFRLVRNLYEQGFGADDVRQLFRLIDWLMELPPVLEDQFWQDVGTFREARVMPFISTPERVGIRRGIRQAIEGLMRLRFGDEGLSLMPQLDANYDADMLLGIHQAIAAAANMDEVRRALADAAAPKKKRAPRKRRDS